jgi:hypothetical protein
MGAQLMMNKLIRQLNQGLSQTEPDRRLGNEDVVKAAKTR